MKNRIYSLVGTGTHNQGAELMANAIQAAVSISNAPGPVVVGSGDWPIEACRRNGLLPFRSFGGRFRGRLANFAILPVTRHLFDMYGPEDVDCVFDASGFAYSTQWGVAPSQHLLDRIERATSRGSHYMLLPQSFGPFDGVEIQNILRQALPKATLVYAREETSLRYLQELLPDTRNVRIAPDFTSLVPGLPSRLANDSSGSCLLVPNARMLDKTSTKVSGNYLQHMINLGKELSKRYSVRVLSHCQEDMPLAMQVAQAIGLGNSIVQHRDPRIVKGIIGSASFVIGSRFHALQAALSQGVIAFALGWSHKYPDLFEYYSWSRGMLNSLDGVNENLGLIEDALTPVHSEEIRSMLKERSLCLKQHTIAMWEEIFECIA